MIEQLSVRDLAVVERADVCFGVGFNAVTGETGAGKSVLLGAIGLLTGARADRALVRAGAAQADVRATFRLPPATLDVLAPMLDEAGANPCEDGCLVVRRTLTPAGTGRCWVNDGPATAALLRRLGEHLVDFHGPHENQSLLETSFQTDALDAFGGHETARAAYEAAYRAWRDAIAKKETLLSGDAETRAREIDMLRFQVREIEDARPDPELDGEMLQADYTAACHAAQILEAGATMTRALTDGEANVVDLLAEAVRSAESMKAMGSPDAAGWLEELSTHARALADLSREAESVLTRTDASPERLQELETRMSLIESLKHKYGRTLPDVLSFLEKAKERLAALEGQEGALAAIDGEIAAARGVVAKAGAALTARRAKAAGALAKAVLAELADLGLARAGFDVLLRPTDEPGPSGVEEISFGFAPNPGEPMRELRAIASSGEISRVMLALKTVLAAHDRIPVLVFDEIDANVGGEIARTVGRKMAALGESRQILCITHLPQVASCGATHFAVRKRVRDDRTFTEIEPIEGEERVSEIARMLGGERLTSVVRRHAEELLSHS